MGLIMITDTTTRYRFNRRVFFFSRSQYRSGGTFSSFFQSAKISMKPVLCWSLISIVNPKVNGAFVCIDQRGLLNPHSEFLHLIKWQPQRSCIDPQCTNGWVSHMLAIISKKDLQSQEVAWKVSPLLHLKWKRWSNTHSTKKKFFQ